MKKITTLALALTFTLGLAQLGIAADMNKDAAMGDTMMKEDGMAKDTMSAPADAMAKDAVMNETVNDEYGFDGDEDVQTTPAPAAK